MMDAVTIPVALTLDDGSVAIMHYVVEGRFTRDAWTAMYARGDAVAARLEDEAERRARAGQERADSGAPAPGVQLVVTRSTTDEAIALEVSRNGLAPRVTSWRRLDPSEIPADRRYRNSWRDNGPDNGIGLDLDKARAERLAVLRTHRNALLDQIDKAANTADDEGRAADARTLRAKRPALRDMPARVAGALARATTPDELDAVTIPE